MLFPLLALLLSPLTTAFILPSTSNNKCTFTLLHRHQSSGIYIHLTTLTDHANALTIDIASHRPPTTRNSYMRLSPTRAFAVAGLLDEQRLTMTSDEEGVLSFEVGNVRWRVPDVLSQGENNGVDVDGAGCEVGLWYGSGSCRERRLDCRFPCEEVDAAEQDGAFVGAGEEEQVKLGLR